MEREPQSSPRQASYRQRQQQRKTHNYTPAAASTKAADHLNAESTEPPAPSPPYPAQDARPSARANRAKRVPDDTKLLTDAEQNELWEQFERGVSAEDDAIHREENQYAPNEADRMLDIDYEAELPAALLRGEADKVIRCLFAAIHVNDRGFIREIPVTTFSEIIRVLEPRRSMIPLASAHLELSADMTRQFGIAPMREVAYEYASVLKEVVRMRRGVRLTLSDYKNLLRGARDLGYQKFALKLWRDLWSEGHTPDTECYNLYMSAAVWNGLHSAGARQKTRVIDFHMVARRKEHPSNRFRQYRVGAGGVRETAMNIFNEMLASGAIANEESFRILITAAAREGDIATVKSILKRVWNVDVDALITGEEQFDITPKSIPTHSPLHPTPQLIYAIAHAFGINNDIPSALRVVDYVARSYQIPIVRAVWGQLFEWTFVLAIDRHGTDKSTGSTMGQLPPESVKSLWDTMTSAPYYIKPTMGMYNILIKNLFQRTRPLWIAEKMREAHGLYVEHRIHARKLWSALQSRIERDHSRVTVEKLRHEFEAADLVRKRDLFWLKRWLRLLLGTFRDAHRGDDTVRDFAETLPGLLWDWRMFAPSIVRYETLTGFVEFKIRSWEETRDFARDQLQFKSRIRSGLKEAERYVGDRWTGGEVRPANVLVSSG